MSARWAVISCSLLAVIALLTATVRHLTWSRDLERREMNLTKSIAELKDATPVARLRTDRSDLSESVSRLEAALAPERARLTPTGTESQHLAVAISRLAGECNWQVRSTQETAESVTPARLGESTNFTFREAPAFRRKRLRLEATTTYNGFVAFLDGLPRLPHRTVLGQFSLTRNPTTAAHPLTVVVELVL